MQKYRVFLVCMFVGLITGCETLKQQRTITVQRNNATGDLSDAICNVYPGAKPGACADHAIVHRYFEFKDDKDQAKQHDYYMSFIEFDDQGWFWDRKQLESLLRLLYGQDQTSNDEYLIILYAHGWQHNAKVCDQNVVCFQRVLERFDVLEQERSKRKVVGVYVGWRGRSVTAPGIEHLTFWERKKAALRVGNGGVTHLISMLNEFRELKNRDRVGEKTQLVITGHSFGGQVVYAALSNLFVNRSAQLTSDNNKIGYDVAKSVGDLVVLINPAFEGSLYEPLYDVATNRCYTDNQRPVMLIVTSEGDRATRIAFPAGRKLNTLFERTQSKHSHTGQRATIVNTVGHLDRYRTHELSLVGSDKIRKANDEGDCGCPSLPAISEFDPTPDKQFYAKLQEDPKLDAKDPSTKEYLVAGESKDTTEFYYGDDLKLTRELGTRLYAANNPYLVIRAKKEIIKDHGSIYDENFTDFLRRFYLRHIKQQRNFPADCFRDVPACIPTAITPCERSCKQADGSSCSSRPANIPVTN